MSSKYAVLYGGVQKNIGPAGMVIAVIREDLITDEALLGTPTMMKYKTHADAGSMYNTPNCYLYLYVRQGFQVAETAGRSGGYEGI